ncbi:glyceraldehyde-3-phosphate dehydrogenase-like family protein isoform X4 [Tasmannia lanceolata]|uniref:glyceraldehyde-3-phosphate dehydrogenase-like family protein isoform X4 n=1 Tax=Tasmannia lanceolata TaxID=3420 RepID=UPI0040645CB8
MRGNMERGSNHTHQVSCPQHNPLGLNNPPQFQPQLHAPNHQFAVPMVTPFDNRNTHFSNFHGNNLAMLNRPPPHLVQPHGQFFSHNAQQNMSPVMSFPSHQQFCNVPQNLNQMVPPQVNGQFFLQNQGPNFNQIMSNGCSHMQNFSQNMPLQPRGQFCSNQMSQNLNQVMGMLHGQTFSQNIMANLNQIMPMQCSQLPINPPMFIPSSMGQNAMQESPIVAQHMQGTHCPVQMHQNQKNLQTVGKQQSQGNHYVSGKRESPHMRFQKSQSHHLANAKGSFKHVSKNGGKGGNSWRSGEFHLERSSGEVVAESQRSQKSSLPFNYTEEGIQQWREQRKKHYPTKTTVAKLTERRRNNELIDADAKMRRKQLKEILAKQAELGVEVAKLPPNYLLDKEDKTYEREDQSRVGNKMGRFQNKFNKRFKHCKRSKRQRLDYEPLQVPNSNIRKPTLLEKLLSRDIKRDKSHLLQVFRFMVLNSFFKDWPEKPLEFPVITVKDGGCKDEIVNERSPLKEGNDTVSKVVENVMVQEIEIENHDHSIVDEENNDDEDESGEEMVCEDVGVKGFRREQIEKSEGEEGEFTD